MDKKFKWSHDTIKILEENIGSKISEISHRSIFADISPWARETKEKGNKWDYIKLKGSYTAKETISKMQREATLWENVFVNDVLDKV